LALGVESSPAPGLWTSKTRMVWNPGGKMKPNHRT
jgi:hypothetical protein